MNSPKPQNLNKVATTGDRGIEKKGGHASSPKALTKLPVVSGRPAAGASANTAKTNDKKPTPKRSQ